MISFLPYQKINDIILGVPFFLHIFPITRWDSTGFSGTFDNKSISFEFTTHPLKRFINEIRDNIILKNRQVNFLKHEIHILTIEEDLQNPKLIEKIDFLKDQFSLHICGDHPNMFWERKKHIVSLPYEEDFSENNISTKVRPCQMNSEYLELCKKEIDSLMHKGLIRPSKSQLYCIAFYVNKHVEQ